MKLLRAKGSEGEKIIQFFCFSVVLLFCCSVVVREEGEKICATDQVTLESSPKPPLEANANACDSSLLRQPSEFTFGSITLSFIPSNDDYRLVKEDYTRANRFYRPT
jgi:hypothetical protein